KERFSIISTTTCLSLSSPVGGMGCQAERERFRWDGLAQLPPTLRGVRVRGTKPREVVAFQGWCVWGFGARVGADVAASDDRAATSAAALARAAAACASSFS